MTKPTTEQQSQHRADTAQRPLIQTDRHGRRPKALQPRLDALHRQPLTCNAPFEGATITPFTRRWQLLRPERANPRHTLSPDLPGALCIGRGNAAQQVGRLIEALQQLGNLRPTQRLRIGMSLSRLHG